MSRDKVRVTFSTNIPGLGAFLKKNGYEEEPMHDSDCATHNEPAMPNGPCDCSLSHGDGGSAG